MIVVVETEALAVGFPAAVVETAAVVEEKVVGTVGAVVGLSARTAAIKFISIDEIPFAYTDLLLQTQSESQIINTDSCSHH